MTFKPKIIITEEIASLIPPLQAKKTELTLARDEVVRRLNTIELVIKENEVLEAKAKEQIAESINLFIEERARVKDCYPEVRLGILQKTLEFVAPVDPKKKK